MHIILRFKALKIFKNTSYEDQSNKEIEREIDILKKLDNKNILKFSNFFFIEYKFNLSTLKQYYLVTPYYEVLFFQNLDLNIHIILLNYLLGNFR
jgi:serine/threonine protein kinase